MNMTVGMSISIEPGKAPRTSMDYSGQNGGGNEYGSLPPIKNSKKGFGSKFGKPGPKTGFNANGGGSGGAPHPPGHNQVAGRGKSGSFGPRNSKGFKTHKKAGNAQKDQNEDSFNSMLDNSRSPIVMERGAKNIRFLKGAEVKKGANYSQIVIHQIPSILLDSASNSTPNELVFILFLSFFG